MKRQFAGGNICKSHVWKRLVSKIYILKNLLNTTIKKTPVLKWTFKDLNTHFSTHLYIYIKLSSIHMEGYSMSLVTREMQIETRVGFHFIWLNNRVQTGSCSISLSLYNNNLKKKVITRVSKNVEKLKPSYIAGRNVKQCSHFGNV